MARTVQVIVEIDDRGSANVRRLATNVDKESKRAAAAARTHFSAMSADVGKRIDALTGRFLRFGSVTGALLGGLAARAVLKFGTDFQASMSGVRAVTGATGMDFERLQKQARDLGANTAFAATEASAAMEELGKAGFTTNEILSVTPDVLNLAGAGMLDMAEAASITSDLMRSLGISVQEFTFATDVVAKTATSSKTTVSELGFAFQDAAPVARSLGIEVVGLNAQLGVLANRGFTGTRAGTALRRIFSVFLGDLEEGEKGLAKFNIEAFNSEGAFVGMANILEQFNEQGVTANDIMEAFGLRGGPAMLQIFRAGPVAIREFEDALRGAGGTAKDVFEERFNNLRGATKELTSALQEMALVIFDKIAPGLTAGAKSATEMVRAWSELLKGADVANGLARAWNGLKLVLVGLGGAVLVGLVRRLQALGRWTGETILGFDALQMSTARLTGVTKLWTSATLAQRAGLLGLGAGVLFASYKITRMILEITGADTAIQNFFDRTLKLSGTTKQAFATMEQSAESFARGLNRLEDRGIHIAFDPESVGGRLRDVADEIDRLSASRPARIHAFIDKGLTLDDAEKLARLIESQTVVKLTTDLNIDEAEIGRLAGEFAALQKRVVTLSDDDLAALRREVIALGADGVRGLELLTRALDVFSKKQKEEDDAAVARAEARAREAADFKKRLEELEKDLGSAGLATGHMAELLQDDWVRAMQTASDAGYDADLVVRAFAERVVAMEAALKRAGETVPASISAMTKAVRALENENAIGGFSQGAATGLALVEEKVGEVESRFDELSTLLGFGQISLGEYQISMAALREEMIRLAEIASPELAARLRSILPDDFDPSQFTNGARRMRQALAGVRDARLDLDQAQAEGISLQVGEFDPKSLKAQQLLIDEQEEHAVQAVQDSLYEQQLAYADNDDLRDQARIEAEERLAAVEQKATNARLKLAKRETDYKKQQIFGWANTAVGALQTVFGESKALAIAAAIINTAQGVTRALADPGGPAGVVLAALVAAAGLAEVAKIRSAKPGARLGGLITGRRDIEVGEAGEEAIIPLEGAAARRTGRALREALDGPGAAFGPRAAQQATTAALGAAQPAPINFELYLTVNGDNWRDSGVAPDLMAQIHSGLQDLIESGVRPALALERV